MAIVGDAYNHEKKSKMESHWLQATVSGVNEKMYAVMNLLEDDDSTTQTAETKETIRNILTDLCTSYCSLAQDYDNLKSTNHKNPVSESLDDSQITEVIDSNSESVVDDPEIIVHADDDDDDDDTLLSSKVSADEMKSKFTTLVEENAEMQLELVKRNTEKREMITKLQDQVSQLMAEKDMLKRHLSYIERNHPRLQTSTSRRSMLVDRLFRCSF